MWSRKGGIWGILQWKPRTAILLCREMLYDEWENLWMRNQGIQVLVSLLCALGKLVDLSEPQFLHLKCGNHNNACLTVFWVRTGKDMNMNVLCKVLSKHKWLFYYTEQVRSICLMIRGQETIWICAIMARELTECGPWSAFAINLLT